MIESKRPERYVHFESIKPELKEVTEFYTRKITDYQHRLKQLNEYADALENEISVLKETPKVEVLLDNMAKQLYEVPKLVADFIEHKRLIDIAKSSVPVKILDWLNEQTGHADFDICVSHLIKIKAIGYTVEKEQLYRVVLPEAINCYLNFRTNTGDAMFGGSEEIGDYKTRFTEQEIKAIDERYWQFAVPVDEV